MRRFWLAPVMLAGAIAYAGLDRDSGLRTWWQLRQELAASRERIALREAEIARLGQAARDLDGDSFAMEAAIRVDLGLGKPSETIVLFTGADAPDAHGSDDSTPRIP